MRLLHTFVIFILLSHSTEAQIQPDYILNAINNCSDCVSDTSFINQNYFEVRYYNDYDSIIPIAMLELYNDTVIFCSWSEKSGDIEYSFSFRRDGTILKQRIRIKGATISLFYYWENGRIVKIENYDDSLHCSNGWHTEFDRMGEIVSQEYYTNGLTKAELKLSKEEQAKLIKRPYDTCLCNEYNK